MTVVTVKLRTPIFTGLPSPDLGKCFYNADLAGDSNFGATIKINSGDGNLCKKQTVSCRKRDNLLLLSSVVYGEKVIW